MTTPYVDKALLDYLQKIFPDKLPTEPVSSDTMSMLIGQQWVIRHLTALHKKQNPLHTT